MLRFRPRLSLLTALLLTTIAGMAIVIVQLCREVGPLRTEVRQLRAELGRLWIEDESKIHAIQVRQDEELTWRWRVWIPQGEDIWLHLQWGDVPKTGVPSQYTAGNLHPGEQWIVLKARRNPKDNTWMYRLETPTSSETCSLRDDQHGFDWKRSTWTGEGVRNSTAVFDDAIKRIILQRHRVGQFSSSRDLGKVQGPTPGFIIWLERR